MLRMCLAEGEEERCCSCQASQYETPCAGVAQVRSAFAARNTPLEGVGDQKDLHLGDAHEHPWSFRAGESRSFHWRDPF